MKNIDQQIQEQYNRVKQWEKLVLHIGSVKEKLVKDQSDLEYLEYILDENQEVLEELENMNSVNLFSKILGNETEQYERVRQSYLLNIIKYKNIKLKIETKQFEIEILTRKMLSLADAKSTYEKLLKQKKSYFKIKNKEIALKMIPLESKIRILCSQIKELNEAISLGENVKIVLLSLSQKLAIIKDWHQESYKQKIPFSYKKRNYINNLFFEIKKVDKVLNSFLQELEDVDKMYTLSYEEFIVNLYDFVETVYDSLISDWIFNKKMKITLQSIEENVAKINRLIAMLESDLDQSNRVINITQEELDNLLKNTSIN